MVLKSGDDEVRLRYAGDLLYIEVMRADPGGFRPPLTLRVRGAEVNEIIAWVKERER